MKSPNPIKTCWKARLNNPNSRLTDISLVASGKAPEEYQDAEKFFARTFITEGMRLLLTSVVQRLSGQGGDPVIQLQTAFGGGKTHTMLTVFHLASRKQERQHFSRKLKWGPSDFSSEKLAGGYCLRRPAFVLLRPRRTTPLRYAVHHWPAQMT